MILPVLSIAVGLLLLAGGGEVLLRGAVGLAQRLKLTPAIIGLTVVAAGTSVPELAVSALASWRGNVDISVGNVIGSNIINGTLIVGLAACITPLAVTGNMIRLEYPVMVLVTLMCLVVIDDGTVSRLDSLLFIATYVGFTAYLVSLVREKMKQEEAQLIASEVEELSGAGGAARGLPVLLGLLAAGAGLLAAGAELTVMGAVELGRLAGLSERVIGLTIVAFGTSLPEVVTSVIAGVRGRDDIAIGNVIGSNIFNILMILGLSGLFNPLAVATELRTTDALWMMGAAVLLFPLMRSGMRINRPEGALLMAAYGVYLFMLL